MSHKDSQINNFWQKIYQAEILNISISFPFQERVSKHGFHETQSMSQNLEAYLLELIILRAVGKKSTSIFPHTDVFISKKKDFI